MINYSKYHQKWLFFIIVVVFIFITQFVLFNLSNSLKQIGYLFTCDSSERKKQAESLLSSSKFKVKRLPFYKNHDNLPQDLGYSGLIPVRKSTSTNETIASIFFWYFPAKNHRNSSKPPLLIWLQGGPGSTSMIGLFNEIGPFKVSYHNIMSDHDKENIYFDKDSVPFIMKNLDRSHRSFKLENNPFSWNEHYALLFIDNPIGTGFSRMNTSDWKRNGSSFSVNYNDENSEFDNIHGIPKDQLCNQNDPDYLQEVLCPEYMNGYAKNQAAIVRDLYSFLVSFYHIFPELKESRLYLAGESYSGKYIPSFAYYVHEMNRLSQNNIEDSHYWFNESIFQIPLKGIAIGDGLVDPYTQIGTHADQALALGLVSSRQALELKKESDQARNYILKKQYLEAFSSREKLFEIFANYSGSINYYDIRKGNIPNSWSAMYDYLKLPQVREALHVSSSKFPDALDFFSVNKTSPVYIALNKDIMKSTASLFPLLLDKMSLKVLLYQGQFDFRDGILSSSPYIESLNWSGRHSYLMADRKIWHSSCLQGNVAGYITEYKNFKRVELRNAGHLAPMDQGCVSLSMLSSYLT